MSGDELGMQAARYVGSSPWVIVALAGVVLCLINFSRAPRITVIVGVALAIKLLSFFVMPFVSRLVFSIAMAPGMHDLQLRIMLNSVIYAIPSSISLGLMLWAVFSSIRDPHEEEYRHD